MFARIRLWAVYLAALALPGVSFAAGSERGRPLIQRFSAQEYRAHYQIWSATQAPEGTMWFGTQGAVVEYDGNTWRKCLIETSFARQKAIGPDGKLYVGGEDSLGWVERMPDGAIEYRSLLDQIPAEAKPIGLSRRVIATADAVYIASDRHVFRWRGGQMKTWSFAGNERATMEAIGGEIILIRGTQGILRLEGSDEFRLLSDPPELKQPQFKFLLPPPPGSGALALLTLGSAGAFLLQPDGSLRPWTNSASDAIKPLQPFSGIQLSDGRYAIGTMNGGLFLIAPDGSSHLRYTMADGLTHDTIIGLGEDREGGLWATTQNGINRIDLVTPATLFDKNTGLGEGIIFEFLRHDGVLYAAANHALLRLNPASGASPAHWAPDPRIPPETPVQRIASHSRGLVVASTDLKLLSASGSETIKENPSRRITVMHRSKTDPDRIFLGYDAVVGSIVWRGGRWLDEGLMEGLSGEPYTMLEEADGTLWVATGTRGVFRVRRPDPTTAWNRAEVQHFYENKGLPKGHGWIFVRQGPFGPDFSMTGGNYFFDNARGEFVRQANYLLEGKRVEGIMEPLEPIPGGVWWASTRRQRLEADIGLIGGRLDPADGLMKFKPAIASIRSLMGISGAQVIYGEEADGIVWLKGMDSVIRYETRSTRPRSLVWRPLLREIRAEGRGQNISPTSPLQLDYSTEPIIFSYSGALFGLNAAPEFQTRLLGFRDTWSEFSRKTEEAFTNLSGGPFVFEVRARDADGRMSEIARQTFTVSPPWYQRPVTFGGYALLLAGAVAGVIRWRTAASERERARLEKIVAERTAELKVAKDAADEANRAKSTFLANMSHELRTPLNGVIGYAQVLMKDRELSEKNRERLRIVQTSGEHLLRMINEVLDFSKIEAGKMELVTTPFHLPQLLRDIAAAVSPRFEQKGLEFVFDPAPDLPDLVLGDPQKLRQVLDNLLGNAAKFTQAGTVRFRAQLSGLETVEFSVADTGVGIAAQDIGRLFQPFQQAVDGRPPEPGTGLGLAISQRLVTLMGSRLGVDSQPGQGSRFFFAVELPVLAVDATAQRTETQAIVGYRGPRRRLLIVDDVATNRHVLRDLLTPLGFTIAEAAGGAEALAVVPQVLPELIFLDLRMPGIDGFELARRLRERPGGKELKIFAMSASVLSFNREKAFAAGCDDFLPKPFREEDLLSRLGLALQLEWVRDAAAPAARPASRHPFPNLTTRLATDVVEELLAIARRGEIAQLRRRLDELKGDPLVDSLDVFVKTYRMERIREVLERHLSSPPAS